MNCVNKQAIRFFLTICVMALVFITPQLQAQPVDNTISYQGRLDIAGMPADGFFDFEAVIFDSLASGNQVSPILTLNNVEVVEGLVNLNLDFGEGVFNGEQRFLELRVRDIAGGGGLVILEPRQPTLAAPYSISTGKVDGDIFQRGTIGTCETNGSAGSQGSVTYPRSFMSSPVLFVNPDESFNNYGCDLVRITHRDELGFSWIAAIANGTPFACDCIHWLAIGPP